MAKRHFLVGVITLFLVTSLSISNAFAKNEDVDMDVWLEEVLNPAVINTVSYFNETSCLNWTVNLSTYLVEGDKKASVKKLKKLREDLSDFKKTIKGLDIPETADKKERKQIKVVKKNLNKAFNQTNKKARRLIKRFDKDKKFKFVTALKAEKKSISKVNTAFSKVNEFNDLEVSQIELESYMKVTKEGAEKVVFEHKEEQKKIAKAKEKKRIDDEAKAIIKTEKKEIEKAKAKKKKEEADAPRVKALNSDINEFISMSEGLVIDIKPFIENGWDVMHVVIDNSWYLQNDGQKQNIVETLGPIIESFVVDSGLSDYSVIKFFDLNGSNVASQKMFGGYEIKK